jgi:hypothetical protein
VRISVDEKILFMTRNCGAVAEKFAERAAANQRIKEKLLAGPEVVKSSEAFPIK